MFLSHVSGGRVQYGLAPILNGSENNKWLLHTAEVLAVSTSASLVTPAWGTAHCDLQSRTPYSTSYPASLSLPFLS